MSTEVSSAEERAVTTTHLDGNELTPAARPPESARTPRWLTPVRLRVVAVVGVIACAMLTSIVLYVDGAGSQRISVHGTPTASGTTVTLDVVGIGNNYSEVVADLIVKPGSALLDPATDGLKQDLTVAVTSATTPVRRTWSKGMLPGVFPVPITLARDVERWPFDSYYTGPITVSLFTAAGQLPERADVTFVDRLTGWKVDVHRVNNTSPTGALRSRLATIGEHDGVRDRHPLHLRGDRSCRLICRDQDRSRSAAVSVADDNLVCRHAVCSATAEKRASRFAVVRKLDRSHHRHVGPGGFGGLNVALHRGLVAGDI